MSPEVVLLALRLALALILYAFLGAVLVYLRRDAVGAASSQEIAPASHLTLLTDPTPGRHYSLVALNLIGRAPDNTIQLDEVTVSSHHARLSFQGGQWWLEDLGSKNGTGLNELDLTEPVVVTYGDQVRLGTVLLELNSGPAPIALAVTGPLPDQPPETEQAEPPQSASGNPS